MFEEADPYGKYANADPDEKYANEEDGVPEVPTRTPLNPGWTIEFDEVDASRIVLPMELKNEESDGYVITNKRPPAPIRVPQDIELHWPWEASILDSIRRTVHDHCRNGDAIAKGLRFVAPSPLLPNSGWEQLHRLYADDAPRTWGELANLRREFNVALEALAVTFATAFRSKCAHGAPELHILARTAYGAMCKTQLAWRPHPLCEFFKHMGKETTFLGDMDAFVQKVDDPGAYDNRYLGLCADNAYGKRGWTSVAGRSHFALVAERATLAMPTEDTKQRLARYVAQMRNRAILSGNNEFIRLFMATTRMPVDAVPKQMFLSLPTETRDRLGRLVGYARAWRTGGAPTVDPMDAVSTVPAVPGVYDQVIRTIEQANYFASVRYYAMYHSGADAVARRHSIANSLLSVTVDATADSVALGFLRALEGYTPPVKKTASSSCAPTSAREHPPRTKTWCTAS